MFPNLATPENITRNNVSATMFPSLAMALEILKGQGGLAPGPRGRTTCKHTAMQGDGLFWNSRVQYF